MRIGIYGGSFNPPHIGHIRAAEYAQKQLALDKLLLIPACDPPHKQLPEDSASPEQRLQMLGIALKDDPHIEVSDLELRRGGVSYTFETVEQIKKMYPDAELFLLMGTDMFLSFENWKNPDRILKNAALGVFYRGDRDEKQRIQEQKAALQQQGARIELVENPVTEISSTDLRRMLILQCADPFLSPGVGDYIRENGLYGTDKSCKELSMEELEQAVIRLLKPNRVAHVLGCRQTARQLAEHHGADPVDAQRAALLHDVTKALDGPLQLTVCSAYGEKLDGFSKNNPKTLHAKTGALAAKRIFGENDAVVSAIASHTTGKAHMNILEKIIYVADYMEPNRDFPGVEKLRSLAYENIDEALKLGLNMTLEVLKQRGSDISPESAQALAWLEQNN